MPDPLTALPLSRRAFVATACATGCLVAAGCSGSDSPTAEETTSEPVEVPVASVPVGGGIVLTDQRRVVTQPEPGVYRAFSATCTHQGCVVSEVADGAITCSCHGSTFSVSDGSVINPPAEEPLTSYPVTLTGETLTVSPTSG